MIIECPLYCNHRHFQSCILEILNLINKLSEIFPFKLSPFNPFFVLPILYRYQWKMSITWKRLGIFSSDFWSVDEISLQTSWFPKFEIWRGSVRIAAISHNILTKFHRETISHCHFSTSWHGMKLELTLRIFLWQIKLIFDAINWANGVLLKMIYNL